LNTRPIIINNTLHPLTVVRRRKLTSGAAAAPLVGASKLEAILSSLGADDRKVLEALIAPDASQGLAGQPEFAVEIVTLKPGANALEPEQYELVLEQRSVNRLVAARFERRIGRFGNIVTQNIGKTELEDATHLDRSVIQNAIMQCSDPASLRRFREAFGSDKAMGELIENQLAATTVTDGGQPVAHDVKRDPRNPRRSVA
jgi:hypothetical protein